MWGCKHRYCLFICKDVNTFLGVSLINLHSTFLKVAHEQKCSSPSKVSVFFSPYLLIPSSFPSLSYLTSSLAAKSTTNDFERNIPGTKFDVNQYTLQNADVEQIFSDFLTLINRSSIHPSGLNPQKLYFQPTPCCQISGNGVLKCSVEH